MQLHRKQVPKTETMVLSKNDYGYCLDVMVLTSEEEWWLDTSLYSKVRFHLFIYLIAYFNWKLPLEHGTKPIFSWPFRYRDLMLYDIQKKYSSMCIKRGRIGWSCKDDLWPLKWSIQIRLWLSVCHWKFTLQLLLWNFFVKKSMTCLLGDVPKQRIQRMCCSTQPSLANVSMLYMGIEIKYGGSNKHKSIACETVC